MHLLHFKTGTVVGPKSDRGYGSSQTDSDGSRPTTVPKLTAGLHVHVTFDRLPGNVTWYIAEGELVRNFVIIHVIWISV